MPANLPPAYKEAEGRFRSAGTSSEKLLVLEEMLALLPKHKGTDKLRAQLRKRYSALEKDMEKQAGGRKGRSLPYRVQREGAGQVHLVGLPNTGKSRLLSTLTKASPVVAAYPFSTHLPCPGMMTFENIQIQLVDLPPLMDESVSSWLPNLLRTADALLLVLALDEDLSTQFALVLEGLRELKIAPYGFLKPQGLESFIRPKRCLIVGTKADLDGAPPRWEAFRKDAGASFPCLSTSSVTGDGLDEVPAAVFRLLDIIRIFTKAPGKEANFSQPLTLKADSTVEDAARATHKDFAAGLRYTRLWGGGKFSGQRVGKRHLLRDGDVLEFHL